MSWIIGTTPPTIIGLGTIFNSGFSPASLFAGGVNGVWYDPSDASTLFSDTAGTTPSPTPGAGALSVVGRMLDKSGNGNHAISYNTTTARPELSARVNLLTYSEQFDNAAWNKFRSAATANATVAPDGTTTAEKLVPNAGLTQGGLYNATGVTTAVGTTYTASVYVKAAELGFVFVAANVTASYVAAVCVNLSTGAQSNAGASGTYAVTNVGNGWWRVTCTAAATAATGYLEVFPLAAAGTQASYTGDGTSGIFVWGAQLTATNQFPANTYQRIVDANTYDAAGFPRYLVFNGTASGMYPPANLNLSGTDKVTVFAGVRKQAAGTGQLVELSPLVFANNGTFSMPSDSGTGNWGTASKGTNPIVLAESATNSYVAPISTVNTGIHNLALSSNVATLRVNGSQVAVSGAGAGGGNFGTYPLNIGVRNAQSAAPTQLFLNGYIYSLIVVGAASTAAQISSTESWINVKEGGVY